MLAYEHAVQLDLAGDDQACGSDRAGLPSRRPARRRTAAARSRRPSAASSSTRRCRSRCASSTNYPMDKENLQGTSSRDCYQVLRSAGPTAEVADQIKRLGFRFATKSGVDASPSSDINDRRRRRRDPRRGRQAGRRSSSGSTARPDHRARALRQARARSGPTPPRMSREAVAEASTQYGSALHDGRLRRAKGELHTRSARWPACAA